MEKKFKVVIVSKAIHKDYYEVTASSKEEALQKAEIGNVGKHIDSHTDIDEYSSDIEVLDND